MVYLGMCRQEFDAATQEEREEEIKREMKLIEKEQEGAKAQPPVPATKQQRAKK